MCAAGIGCALGNACSGTPPPCSSLSNVSLCADVQSCHWNEYQSHCQGPFPVSCETYTNGTDCDGQPGCDWLDVCLGQATACEALPAAMCEEQRGCNLHCPTGLTLCGYTCVDLDDDEAHCGQCDASCGPRGLCTDATCECPAPFTVCGDQCVDLTTDSNNCHACGNACGTGAECVDRACEDVDECATAPCTGGRPCTNIVGSFVCGVCPTGFAEHDSLGCTDIDECAVDNGGCDPLVTCTNTPGGFSCGACPGGYTGSGTTGCTDIDECAVGNGGCDELQFCINSTGAFSCSACPLGYVDSGASGCVDIDECATSADDCDNAPLATCIDSDGSYQCDCPDGYTGNGHGPAGCLDIDECSNGTHGCNLSAGASCADHDGGYQCTCAGGYAPTPTNPIGCVDIDECATSADDCDDAPLATCIDSDGSYQCDCPDGYMGSGHGAAGCLDIDECSNGSHDCDLSAGASCVDEDGGYQCTCPGGFAPTVTSPIGCVDVDECVTGSHDCDLSAGASCVDQDGSYECTCPTGYAPTATSPIGCVDVDECATGTHDCDLAAGVTCVDEDGGFQCICSPGYEPTSTNPLGCMDIDECAAGTHVCASPADCEDLEGSYLCRVRPVMVAVGLYHSCALLATGQLKCWGANGYGQLGIGDTRNRGVLPADMGTNLPYLNLGTGRKAVAVDLGSDHGCALLDDGMVKCWGRNSAGECGLGDTLPRGDQPDDMGDNLPTVDLGPGRTATAISVAGAHSCALLDDATVKCWGGGGFLGQGDGEHRGDQPNELGANLLPIDLGSGRTVESLVAFMYGACVVFTDGAVKCWGYNETGLLGLEDTNTRGDEPGEMGDALPVVGLGTGRMVIQLASNEGFSCALLDDASTKCWGTNWYSQLGLGFTSYAQGDEPGEMDDDLPAVDLGTGFVPREVRVGTHHACVVTTAGALKCWGANGAGWLGLGDTAERGSAPEQMGNALPFVNLGTGRTVSKLATGWHSCAILDDNSLKCWGPNDEGELGLGHTRTLGDQPNEMGDALPAVLLGP
jgi:alpha-tubulin suppressor-like RCC1 family protein